MTVKLFTWQDIDMKCHKCGHQYDGQGSLEAKYVPLCRKCFNANNDTLLIKFKYGNRVRYAKAAVVFNHKLAADLWKIMTR